MYILKGYCCDTCTVMFLILVAKDATGSYVVIKARQVGGELRAVHSDSRGGEVEGGVAGGVAGAGGVGGGAGGGGHQAQPAFVKVSN